MIALAEGIGWTRSPVPGSLNHINLWLLEDGPTARMLKLTPKG